MVAILPRSVPPPDHDRRSEERRPALGDGTGKVVAVVLLLLGAAAFSGSGGRHRPRQRGAAVADTIRLVTEAWGAGTPVVIVPGVLGSAYSFRKVIPSLVADSFRVTVVDPLGFGASPHPAHADYSFTAQADRVAATMERVAGRPAILVCHALSGPICLRIGYRHPELVRGIVSINGGASDEAGTAQMRRELKLGRLVLKIAGRGFALHKVRNALIRNSGDASWVTDSVVAQYVAPFGPDAREIVSAMERVMRARDPEPLVPNLPRVAAPVLLLVGLTTHDAKKLPLDESQRSAMRQGLPHLEEEVVPGAGEFIQEEQPSRVIAAVEKLRSETR